MHDILYGMLIRLGAATGYNVYIPSPNVVLAEHGNICDNYKNKHKSQCEASGLVGYFNKHYTIDMPSTLKSHDLADQPRLLHELVQYV